MTEAPGILQRLFSLEGKVALVTGATGGIGRALALGLAEAGAAVGIHGRNPEHLEQAHQEVVARGARAAVLPADLTDVDACRMLAADCQQALGGLDILINCAGMNRRKPLKDATVDDFDTIIAANLRSVFVLSQAAYPYMRARGRGKIVNIGSMTSSIGLGGVGVYGMTKAAMAQLTRTMAVEWATANIQVNCLAPGFIVTPLTEQGLFGDEHRRSWILERIPARRPGTPDDLVGTALFLCSSASDYLTGQLVSVDGGFLAGGSWLTDDS